MIPTLKSLIEILNNSEEFNSFIKTNPKATPCAGFFILDFKENNFQYTIDYKIDNNIFSFNINPETKLVTEKQEELIDKSKPLNEVDLKIGTGLEELRSIVEHELVSNNIKNPLEKIIAVLQAIPENNESMWNLTCMCQGFNIIMIHINALDGKIIKFEKKSLFDFVKQK